MEPVNRPKITIPKSVIEKSIDIMSLALLLISIVYVLMVWSSLPSEIPIHFNIKGEVDRWGGKEGIWFLPAIGVFIWLSLTILEKYPHKYNYLNLTLQNAKKQYLNARLLVNVLKGECVFVFVFFTWQSVNIANGNNIGIGIWELPISYLLYLLLFFFLLFAQLN
ncbi:putative membrane protein [Bacillus pakistanensis]|uniref:Membrane protein n=1 Tax=Rossellomorea pakistanensis TaxID=992288 RepID=A0ABS2N7J8_9BACI|nr:DUF1648 domain-containing protein [Bacillus pakistanensis]MBM7583770.1 putative membrane protein [Bacillus pakistanensis]